MDFAGAYLLGVMPPELIKVSPFFLLQRSPSTFFWQCGAEQIHILPEEIHSHFFLSICARLFSSFPGFNVLASFNFQELDIETCLGFLEGSWNQHSHQAAGPSLFPTDHRQALPPVWL